MDLKDPWTDVTLERGVSGRRLLRRYALAVLVIWILVGLAAALWWLLA